MGRLLRLLASVMALQAGGRQLDYTIWDENKAHYVAAIQAGMTDYEPMKKLGQASVTRHGKERRCLILSSISRTGFPVEIAVELATLRIVCRVAFAVSRR